MTVSYAPFRLLYHHPFGTAHGVRTGTDALFLRLEHNGVSGYGEVAIPPYIETTISNVIQEINNADLMQWFNIKYRAQGEFALELPKDLALATRSVVCMAYYDLMFNTLGITFGSDLEMMLGPKRSSLSMATLGSGEISDIKLKLNDLPNSAILKVKLSGSNDLETVKEVISLDNRPLFLDANQGWAKIEQALELIDLLGEERMVGIEQPFAKDDHDLHKELKCKTKVEIFADESSQDIADLEAISKAFSGVNIKLLKCGGLDKVIAIIRRCRELDLKVMLGCMSEGSLGCGAMAQLAPYADLVDLDGPWLINNDPFTGMVMDGGSVRCIGSKGFGVSLKHAAYLNWTTIGA